MHLSNSTGNFISVTDPFMRRIVVLTGIIASTVNSFKSAPIMKKFLMTSTTSGDLPSAKKARVDSEVAKEQPNTQLQHVKLLESNEHSIMAPGEVIQALNTSKSTNWIAYNTIMYKFADRGASTPDYSDMIAFDLDGTLITTKSGHTFAKTTDDWKFWDSRIPKKLKELHEQGKYIAIVSNQNGIQANQTTPAEVQKKVDSILAQINSIEPGIPIDFICAIDDDHFRKPRTGMFEFLALARCPNAMKDSSLYVGDAAGREKEGIRPKDFSDSDLKAALNLGIAFETPERFFYRSNQRLHTQVTVRDGIRLCDGKAASIPDPALFTIGGIRRDEGVTTSQDIVLIVSPPACGKSTLAKRFTENGYVKINQDTLKTADKCFSTARTVLSEGKSVCVDNTNMDPTTRARWVSLGHELRVPVRCVILRTSKQICSSLALYRLLSPETAPEDRRKIGSIVINTYFKEPMKWPTDSEAFSRIDEVEWSPVPPTTDKALRLFSMYLK